MRKRRQSSLNYENLETRKLLAVTAEFVDGDLFVSGEADGNVEIIAVSETSFKVTDDGVTIADESTLANITDDIRINLRGDVSDNSVVVDLANAKLDMVYAALGEGDNSFDISGGEIERFIFRGGDGDDSVALDSAVNSAAYFRLGGGDDTVDLSNEIARANIVSGQGDDSVSLDSESVLQSFYANVGEGQNTVALNGKVDGNIRIRTNDGDNSIHLSESSKTTGDVRLTTDVGANQISVEGIIEGALRIQATDGDDSLEIGATAVVDSVRGNLGDGVNYVFIAGTVVNNVNIASLNADDTFEVAETASIGGESELLPGDQTDSRTGNRHHRFSGRHRFGFSPFSGRGFGFHHGSRFSGFGGFKSRPFQPDTPPTDNNPTTPEDSPTTPGDETPTQPGEADHDHNNTSEGWDGDGQGSAELTYYIGNIPSGLSLSVVTEAIETALSAWSEVADITFTQTNVAGLEDSLDFSFVSIDGSGGTVAQAYFPDDVNLSSIAGDVQFDLSESWEVGNSQGNSAFDLVYVAVHEIGHALGLEHTDDTSSVLYPSVSANQQFQGLSQADVDAVRKLYSANSA